MKRISKYVSVVPVFGLLVSVACMSMAPVTGYALSVPVNTSPFCSTLGTKAANASGAITTLTNKVTTAWEQQDQKITSDEQAADQRVASVRASADATRGADYAKLQTKATTASEQTAVQTYITSVNAAVNTRRAAYDAARQVYRMGLTNAVASHRTTITAQVSTFTTATNTALGLAVAGCATSALGGPTLRTTLVASLSAARVAFQTDRKGDTTLTTQITQLAATRDAAFKAADTTFTTTVRAAAQQLQRAFGSTSA